MKKLILFTFVIVFFIGISLAQADESKWFEIENYRMCKSMIFENGLKDYKKWDNSHRTSRIISITYKTFSLERIDKSIEKIASTSNFKTIIVSAGYEEEEEETEVHTHSDNDAKIIKKMMAGVEGDGDHVDY